MFYGKSNCNSAMRMGPIPNTWCKEYNIHGLTKLKMWCARGAAISDSCAAVHILVVTMFQLLLLTLASWTTCILQALSVPVQCV